MAGVQRDPRGRASTALTSGVDAMASTAPGAPDPRDEPPSMPVGGASGGGLEHCSRHNVRAAATSSRRGDGAGRAFAEAGGRGRPRGELDRGRAHGRCWREDDPRRRHDRGVVDRGHGGDFRRFRHPERLVPRVGSNPEASSPAASRQSREDHQASCMLTSVQCSSRSPGRRPRPPGYRGDRATAESRGVSAPTSCHCALWCCSAVSWTRRPRRR
jgi:hypothetical protein